MNGSDSCFEPQIKGVVFFFFFPDMAQPQNFKDRVRCLLPKESSFLGEVCACTRGGGKARERGPSSPE